MSDSADAYYAFGVEVRKNGEIVYYPDDIPQEFLDDVDKIFNLDHGFCGHCDSGEMAVVLYAKNSLFQARHYEVVRVNKESRSFPWSCAIREILQKHGFDDPDADWLLWADFG